MKKLKVDSEFKNLIPRKKYEFVQAIPPNAIEFSINYFVCPNGDFYSTAFKKVTGIIKLHPRDNGKGYLRIDVYGKTMYAHRIVANSFLLNTENYNEINHKNCNKYDNRVENLEWCSHRQNQKHAFDNGKITIKHLSDIGKIGGGNRGIHSRPGI
jgi:hypothetical protein